MKHYYTADVLENSVSVAAHIAMAGYLIALGDHLKVKVEALDDDLKAQVAHMVETTTFAD